MSYQLGIDFGTTFLAAAVRRADGPADTVPLSSAAAVVPAALHLARDGGVTVGEGALRRAGIDPGRVVRAVKRRVDDAAPIVAGGTEWTPEDLSARMVRWVVDRVAEHEGGPAAGVVLAHPASWTTPVLERLAAALDGCGVAATLLAEPHAVALAHAAAGGDVGDTVAVYDLGGGRCETAVLRRDGGWPGFTPLGRPEGLSDVGGLDLDDVLWDHVRTTVADGMTADARTRRACTRAKETLSTRSEVVVRVGQGELRRELRLDRATFEGLIGPHVTRTVAALRRTLASAELGAGGPATVLLAGGSSRIPLVARMVAQELGRPVTVVDEPELVVARGAALAGADAGRAALLATDAVRIAGPGPVAAEPVVVEPVVVVEPAASERAIPKRAIAKRAASEPVTAEPAVSERVVSERVVTKKSAGSKPVVSEPVVSEPVVSEPVVAGPVVAGPAAAEPVVARSAVAEPIASEPVVAGPVVAGPAAAEAVAARSAVAEPIASEPVVAGPAAAEPVVAEPAVAEPATSRPAVARPVVSEPATVRLMAPVNTPPVIVAPAPSAQEPLVPVRPAAGPVAPEHRPSEPVASEPVASDAPTAELLAQDGAGPVPTPSEPAAPAAPRRFAPTRPTAVLDGPRGGAPRRSLPRLLIGAGAVAAAALVVVALFRPDGPLDPPLDPGRDVAVRSTSAPVVPAPNAVPADAVPVPAAEAVPAEVRTTAPLRARPLPDGTADLPADVHADPARSSVNTTPPATPRVRSANERPASGGVVPAPVGAAPRVPPTPAAPGV